MKLHEQDALNIIPALDRLAHENRYQKILAKIPSQFKAAYEAHDYAQEAVIPEYFKNRKHLLFMAKYISSNPRPTSEQQPIQDILSLAERQKPTSEKNKKIRALIIQTCQPEDAIEMSHVFGSVFKTYPFPIFDADYLFTVMKEKQAQYFCIRQDGRIVSISAAEIDPHNRGVEMTEFVTLPAFRRQGFAGCLLEEMEQSMAAQNMRTALSIARALSPAMNVLFASRGYIFGGTLANNTNIAGRIESMNVWYKHL